MKNFEGSEVNISVDPHNCLVADVEWQREGSLDYKEKSDGSTAGYYQLPSEATELQQLIAYRNMNAQIGEIFRACYRYGLVSHSDMLRDAKKMKFYAEAEIERLEKYGHK